MSNPNELTPRAEEMFPVIEKYLSSNLPQRTFCTQENLTYSTFQFWLKKYRTCQRSKENKEGAVPPYANGFIPLRVQAPKIDTSHSLCTIEYPNGVIVRLSGKLDPDLFGIVTQLVQVAGL